MTVSSHTSGYCGNFGYSVVRFSFVAVILADFAVIFGFLKKFFWDKGQTCLPAGRIVFGKGNNFGWLFRRFFKDKGLTSLPLLWAELFLRKAKEILDRVGLYRTL